MSSEYARTHAAALDLIEAEESRHLAWGLLDESWDHEALIAHLAEHWEGEDPKACVKALVAANSLLEVPKTWPTRYRSRMAESVRLFCRLRQLFPGKPWQSGATLVSDYRFLRRARAFPERTITADAIADALQDRNVTPAVVAEVRRIIGARKLSRFQQESAHAVFAALNEPTDQGVVVGAGTGSGKTLAFYLPTLASIAASTNTGPRAIAIYPRNELLKDQLANALRETRALRDAGGRQLTIGAYFGPTPTDSKWDLDASKGWRRRNNGWLCPFLTCPAPAKGREACGGGLLWDKPTRVPGPRQWGELTCVSCGSEVSSDEVRLTRNAMGDAPPDILFTTTEMLNQQMSNGWSRHVFGIGGKVARPPKLILLDEVHTYAGTSGAQVAFLLRRWRRLMGGPITWVGLSATLANAASFFADLVGLSPDAVAEIRPAPEDLTRRGSEYQLLLRGDPASQSALLSTSIQSLMLLRRILDENDPGATGVYGSRVFAFLENLDLVNRLFRQVLDAEARNPLGKPDNSRPVLAALRNLEYLSEREIDIGDVDAWDRDGQHWWMVEQLGFGTRSLEISRTSSQDSGVDSNADVVIATASLEVGYDDPRVGAVLQHKAPRDIAQFLQRKGRAGRQQHQRPWAVVVLSDYGRDRQVFHAYESILDPTVPAKNLPLGNQSVRKMQAAMCLVEWLALRLNVDGANRVALRPLLGAPSDKESDAATVEAVLRLLKEVLDGGPARQHLVTFVGQSLRLSPDEVSSVCWEHPRSLLLEAVPTLHRRLSSEWSTVRGGSLTSRTDLTGRHPLPEFIPSTLFADLILPEVEIRPPEGYDAAAQTSIPVAMALSELAPGRVTLRWAVQKVRGLWVEPPAVGGAIDLEAIAPDNELTPNVMGPDGPVPLIRPLALAPTIPPKGVRPTSNGRLHWIFDMQDADPAINVPRPRNSPLGTLVPSVSAFLGVGKGPLQTWRYAVRGTADLALQEGRVRRDYTFTYRGEPAAIGYPNAVDALVVRVDAPDSLDDLRIKEDVERLRQLRSDRFALLVRAGLEEAGASPFLASWMSDVALCVAAAALLEGYGVADLRKYGSSDWRTAAEQVVDGVLMAQRHTDLDEAPLRQSILDGLENDEFRVVLAEASHALDGELDQDWLAWLQGRFVQTVAAAWQAAAQHLCPEFNLDSDVAVDVLLDRPRGATFAMSDAAPGGGALIEALVRRISDDPRRFDCLVVSALEPADAEHVDVALRRTVALLAGDPAVQEAAQRFRNSKRERLEEWLDLIDVLADRGVGRSHAILAALAARIFRPGSGPPSDALLAELLQRWDDAEGQAGFAIDHRAISAFLAKDGAVLARLDEFASGTSGSESPTRAQSVLMGLLWTRGCAARPQALRATNRFLFETRTTERTLVRTVLPPEPQSVDVDDPSWRTDLARTLRAHGRALLRSADGNADRLSAAVRNLVVDPVDLDWLRVFPQVQSMVREVDGAVSIRVVLREAPQ